ncbi:MAG: ABC transporter permease [Monoglobales bacterium]
MVKKLIKNIYSTLVYLFLYAPILIMVVYSFNGSKFRNKWGGFSLKWYKELFNNHEIIRALWNTLIIAAVSAIISTIIGIAASWLLYRMKNRKFKSVILNTSYLPMLNPDIVTGVSMMILFVFIALPRGFATLLLAHITFSVPYIVQSLLPKFNQLNKNTYEAALDLGATPWEAFYKVILPELIPGIATGMLLAFTLSIDDFVISFFTTGPGVSNLSIMIYSMTRKGINPSINALSTIMFLSVLFLLITVNTRLKDKNPKN